MQRDNAIKMSYVVHRHNVTKAKKTENACTLYNNMATISYEFGFDQIETP